ncbi:unnamed protein product [Peronospora belbahrii]|uniref:Uncharacterized protein n=1 Tax=Peronospora belbahrii TaxID=622444 RepID=A0AAU9L598_9STRA|nr:unnamed protein product [Peronospora belbahrii]CAH0522012.1 unnamed protein product [Peronospora belbahrii]
MVRFLVRRPARRCFSSVHAPNVQFEFLSMENDKLLPISIVTKRVLEYLMVDQKDIKRVLSAKEQVRPLPYKTLFAPQQVHQLTPLVQWSFQKLQDDSSDAADAVFAALEPHANMARNVVWQRYFLRQFFLSGAPLQAYMKAYKSHKDAFSKSREQVVVKEEKGDEDDEEEKGDEEVTKKKDNVCLSQGKASTILIANKEWEWVPMYVATGIVKEFCFRGRFAEAIEAYASLPLTDTGRHKVVTILQNYEQYLSILYLYEVHRAMGDTVTPLDVAPEFDALKKVGRVEEMDMRFQELPVKEQSRADIQELMGN